MAYISIWSTGRMITDGEQMAVLRDEPVPESIANPYMLLSVKTWASA
jgi:hypothetical protein